MRGTMTSRRPGGGARVAGNPGWRWGRVVSLLLGVLFLAACQSGPATTPLPGATVGVADGTVATACTGGGCQPTATATVSPTATPMPPSAAPVTRTATIAPSATPTLVPPTATTLAPTAAALPTMSTRTVIRTPASAPNGQYLPGYPEEFYIAREVVVTIDGKPFIVGLPEKYLGDSRVEEVIRSFVHNTQLIDQSLETGDETLLVNATSGPELDRDLPALRQLRDKGQSTRVRREWIRLAFVTLESDKAGVFVVTGFSTVTVDRRTGTELHRTDPREISYVTVLQQSDGVWKNNDSRSLQ
mgnify:CR=1 FL=1